MFNTIFAVSSAFSSPGQKFVSGAAPVLPPSPASIFGTASIEAGAVISKFEACESEILGTCGFWQPWRPETDANAGAGGEVGVTLT